MAAHADEIRAEHLTGDTFILGIRDHRVVIDQPRDADGDDLGPTPTELFVGSLAGCVGFYAERYLRRHDLPDEGLCVRARYVMSDGGPPRVQSVELRVILPAAIPRNMLAPLQRVIERCTVHNSIMQAPAIGMRIIEAEEMAVA